MDRWPTDDRENGLEHSHMQGTNKDKGKESSWDYPVVEQGSLNSATLCRNSGRLEWSFIIENISERKLLPWCLPVQIFPATRSLPPLRTSLGIVQQAEHGAHFVETIFPESSFTPGLIREVITEDIKATENQKQHDGNILETICCGDARNTSAYLVFPMGENRHELNISPLTSTTREPMIFKPTAKAAHTFQTPIQQIVTSSPTEENMRETAVVAVRASTTTLLQVIFKPIVSTLVATTVFRGDVGDRPVVDLAISPSEETAVMMVNDIGAVYKCSVPEGDKIIQLVCRGSDSSATDGYYKISVTDREDSCILLSKRAVKCIDFRTRKDAMTLYNVKRPGTSLISVEGGLYDGIVRLVTNDEIVYLDERFPTKPLVGVKHSRSRDYTLNTRTRKLAHTPVTFLTSRQNGLVTIYDVSRSDDMLVHLHTPPYCLPSWQSNDEGHAGFTLLRHPTYADARDISMFRLSERGAIHAVNLGHALEPDDGERPVKFEWSADVRDTETRVKNMNSGYDPQEERRRSQEDLQADYQKLFNVKNIDCLEDNPEATYDTLDKMPDFWQDMNAPLEHAVTSFDIAFASGSEPVKETRADFSTGCVLNSTRGYRAMVQGRIPLQSMIKRAPWHFDMTQFLHRSIPELQDDPAKMVDSLRRYDLASNSDRPAPSLRRESEAREQLALDLALSKHTFATQAFDKSHAADLDDAFETISRATEAMSLVENEPSAIQFGYLRPVLQEDVDHYSKTSKVQPLTIPAGVRLLLKEWEIGSDPHNFSYRDPYKAYTQGIAPSVRHSEELLRFPPTLARETATQRPPTVLSSVAPQNAPPKLQPARPVAVRSMGATFTSPQVRIGGSQSALNDHAATVLPQEMMVQTQVLPGAHGGRPSGKRNLTRKRVGGF